MNEVLKSVAEFLKHFEAGVAPVSPLSCAQQVYPASTIGLVEIALKGCVGISRDSLTFALSVKNITNQPIFTRRPLLLCRVVESS